MCASGTLITLARQDSGSPPAPSAFGLERHVRAYVADFPRNGAYRPPSAAERAGIGEGITRLLDGRPDAARGPLSRAGYGVRTVRLAGSGRRVAQVTGTGGRGASRRGWGEVYVDLSSRVRWSAQVPHPVSDQHTELMGAELFSRAPGGVLVLAGATRHAGKGNTADVAHREDSVFDAVCAALAARRIPGIQVHGFADDSSPGNDVVVSPGPGRAGALVREAAHLLFADGFEVCRAWRRDCGELEGTTNVQARTAAAHDVSFLHIETSRSVRDSPRARSRMVHALARTAGRLGRG
ncbi:hypothetical protein HUT19_10155 [Streptomyces sp. NA02950]|uniref:hypothetical protein n=1 Tax=Streptomyces sp. NA02950 TaxID=2742137 RepID=UPI001592044E|nr:hypothetical protein [Streptomyces sp. NA02950]QKV92061.1 hypothetical protein HUT19_10155 [Streptomyces sp. NA02950]